MAAPAGRTAILNVAADVVKLAIEIVDKIVCVNDGAVYRFVSELSVGAAWPNTL
jgi:hypothetical protein